MANFWFPHLKLQFGGSLGNPAVEIWSNTVNFNAAADRDDPGASYEPTPEELDDALQAIDTPIRTWFSGAPAHIGQAARLEWAKLNLITSTGHQRDLNTHERAFVNPIPRGQAATPVPHWYETVVLTHRTALSRGRGHAGRIYPPCIAVSPESVDSPYISEAVATEMADFWATTLEGLSEAIRSVWTGGNSVPVYPVVASIGLEAAGPGSFGRVPMLTPVTGVVCDRVADVQHRRTHAVGRREGTLAAVTIV